MKSRFKSVSRLCVTALKMVLKPHVWRYSTREYCPSCNRASIIAYSVDVKRHIERITSEWKSSDSFKHSLIQRENHFCCYCNASYRLRMNANTVLELLGLSSSADLLRRLQKDKQFHVYETAAYNTFRSDHLRKLSNYVVSEFFEHCAPGVSVNSIRNENLECLTFPDNSFDVVINSDVLEHVADLDKALSEIRRVLKPGGFHVFTVPADHNVSETLERARVVDGAIQHLLEPVMHGDSIRGDGILAFRDFGRDASRYMSRDGFTCRERRYAVDHEYITSVFYAQKACR